MVGILLSYWVSAYFQGLKPVSFREGKGLKFQTRRIQESTLVGGNHLSPGCFGASVRVLKKNPKFKIAPEKIAWGAKRKVVFKPSIFRGYVKLRGCIFFMFISKIQGKHTEPFVWIMPFITSTRGAETPA